MRITNLGSLNIDRTYQLERFVEPKETVTALGYEEHCGGKGLNQSVALARAGAEVYHAGLIGSGGDLLLETLQRAGVHTQLVRRTDAPGGHAVIQVDAKGQNSIIVFGGANERITREYIDMVLQQTGAGNLLLLQNEVSNIDYAIEKASEMGILIAFNPSPFNERILRCRLELVDYFLVNEVEGRLLGGAGSLEPCEIIEKLKRKFPRSAFVVTFGENGSYYAKDEVCLFQPAFPVTACDTTAAGDTYCGYFLAGLASGKTLGESMRQAAAASALAVTVKGAAPSIPSREEVTKFLLP